MKFTFTGTYTIDIEKERDRIRRCFLKPQSMEIFGRQIAILDAFENQKIEKMYELYDALPYNDIQECSEKEYVGMWMQDIGDIITFSKFDITEQKLIK